MACFVVLLWFALRAPYKQRDEARDHLRGAHDLHDLVQLERQLRAIKDHHNREIDDARSKYKGPVAKDHEPWLVHENRNMRAYLTNLGFGELVPQIVLDQETWATWEEVFEAAVQFNLNISLVLEGEVFSRYRDEFGMLSP